MFYDKNEWFFWCNMVWLRFLFSKPDSPSRFRHVVVFWIYSIRNKVVVRFLSTIFAEISLNSENRGYFYNLFCYGCIKTLINTIRIYERRKSINWKGRDTFYDMWLLATHSIEVVSQKKSLPDCIPPGMTLFVRQNWWRKWDGRWRKWDGEESETKDKESDKKDAGENGDENDDDDKGALDKDLFQIISHRKIAIV